MFRTISYDIDESFQYLRFFLVTVCHASGLQNRRSKKRNVRFDYVKSNLQFESRTRNLGPAHP